MRDSGIRKRVVVAMSGGVDSSTAAALLKEKGFEVIGATLCIGRIDSKTQGALRCCDASSIEDARRIALRLGIPFYVFEMGEKFEKEVIQYFCDEYLQGKTPNPCILCNERIKFGSFMDKALQIGGDYVATGHYARLEFDEKEKEFVLKKGIDQRKDQSYFLFSLTQAQLLHILFPLGEYRKEEVRRKAFELGLSIHNKPESQEVCFISENSYHYFLKERVREALIQPGPILDQKGNFLGKHKGIAFYTIGQRRGLGLAKGRPLYVTRIDPLRNAIFVGEEREVYQDTFIVTRLNWISSKGVESQFRCHVKIRYNHSGGEAIVSSLGDGEWRVRFQTPQKAITPGQAAVFYEGDRVLGGGWIKEVQNDKA
ncbi:MAG: tRNA 2-thiouridine(34) synthase MnmA [Thermodesulfobacteriota bacterium]